MNGVSRESIKTGKGERGEVEKKLCDRLSKEKWWELVLDPRAVS